MLFFITFAENIYMKNGLIRSEPYSAVARETVIVSVMPVMMFARLRYWLGQKSMARGLIVCSYRA